jgi:hypothetical protein
MMQHNQRGGIALIVGFALIPLSFLFIFVIDALRIELIQNKMDHALKIFLNQTPYPENTDELQSKIIIPPKYLGSHDFTVLLTDNNLSLTATVDSLLPGRDHFAITVIRKLKDQQPRYVVLAIDCFSDKDDDPNFSRIKQAIRNFLDRQKDLLIAKKLFVALIPYAGSVNIGQQYVNEVIFPAESILSRSATKKRDDFLRKSSKNAALTTSSSKKYFQPTATALCWKGCISTKADWDSNPFFEENYLPYFWPSTFGQRYEKNNKLINVPIRGKNYIVLGNNNWKHATIEDEMPVNNYGFPLGPNLGCPPPLTFFTSNYDTLVHELNNITQINRSGSLPDLALAAAEWVISQAPEESNKSILLIKNTKHLLYDWPGPIGKNINDSYNFPAAPGAPVAEFYPYCDYCGYGGIKHSFKNTIEERTISNINKTQTRKTNIAILTKSSDFQEKIGNKLDKDAAIKVQLFIEEDIETFLLSH